MSLRPSNLPKLALCACYEASPDAGPAAARGTQLDALFRRRLRGDLSHDENTNSEDVAAVDWAIETLRVIAADQEIVSEEDRCKIAVLGLTGTGDAWIPEIGASADLKTGQIRNYREQMAAYALGFMEATFRSTWTTHLLFCDQRQLVSHEWKFDETRGLVRELIERFHDTNKSPQPCEYCSWCAKAQSCPARQELAASALVPAENPSSEFNFELILGNNELLGKFLTACATLDDFRERAEAAAKDRLIAGQQIPGWKTSSRKAPEFVHANDVGRYISLLGVGAVLAAYGNLSAAKFREIWAAKSSDPFPEEIVQRGKGSVSLRQVHQKPQLKN